MNFSMPVAQLASLWITAWATTLIAAEVDVWIGTTTPRGGASKGIYHARLDVDSGRLSKPSLAAEIPQPGFLVLRPDGKTLYATGEVDGQPSVVAYRVDDRSLSWLNSQPTGDGGAAHLATDRSGMVLFSAQYGGGSTATFSLRDDGSIEPRTTLIEHEGGSGVVADRQQAPHPHWVGTSPDNRFLLVPDLGLDQVLIYALDADQARLTPHGAGNVPPGGGSRHMVFHTSGKYIYVLNELALAVTVFEFDAAAGTMTSVQTIPTVSEQQKAKESFVSGSEIRMHPSGRFVYATNRGHDTITAFRIDTGSGKLTEIECEPIRGAWPRNFNIDSSGRWLLAAGRDSHTISVFEIDPESGELTFTRHIVPVPTPICVVPAGHEQP